MMTRLADVVSVSTAELGARRGAVLSESARHKIRVIPNACHWPLNQRLTRQRRVSWRGGQSHEVDLCSVLNEVVALAKDPQFGKWEWCFLGDVPWQAKLKIPPQRVLADFGAEPWLYMEALNRLEPWVHIVPLEFNPFNMCKSNLAWIEASAAGAIVVAPDLPEWRKPGVLLYRNPEHFGRVLRKVMEAYTEETRGWVTQSQAHIKENLRLEQMNQKRWEILNELYERKSKTV